MTIEAKAIAAKSAITRRKNITKREGTRSCWDRPGAGEGETELNRLFYRLGWTKGWYKGALRDKVYVQLSGENATPDLKAIKTKLIEMARKYDAAGRAAA